MNITIEQFKRYVAVQESGVTNMWNVTLVSELAELTKAQVMYIMKNYNAIKRFHDPYNKNWDRARFEVNLKKYKDFI